MFEKIMNWTGQIFECVPRRSIQYCDDDFSYYATDHDPRELPRPEKYPNLELPTKAGSKKQVKPDDNTLVCTNIEEEDDGHLMSRTELVSECNCFNCRELVAGLAECPICLECYKRAGVSACPHCANVTCWKCSAKLTVCPFCRMPLTMPPTRNHAMERLIAKLQLPCSSTLLSKDKINERLEDGIVSRLVSDSCWNCLLSDRCSWKGDVAELATHLEVIHHVSVLVGSSITVEIGGFRSKVRASITKTRHYVVSLASYASLFLCQISLEKKRLRLEFSGITTVAIGGRSSKNNGPKFGAWLEVGSQTRTMKGIMPVSVNTGRSKELFINCEGLLSPWKHSDDKVNITITIRPLN